MSRNKQSTAIKGATGEFFVASYLSALGFVVALPRGGVPSSDLLVTNSICSQTITLQVKTATKPLSKHGKYGEYLSWSISKKSIHIKEKSHWYAFVDLKGWPKGVITPDIYFVPSMDVAGFLETDWNKEDATWLFYSIFKTKKDVNSQYVIAEKIAGTYKGLIGFENLESFLNHPPPKKK